MAKRMPSRAMVWPDLTDGRGNPAFSDIHLHGGGSRGGSQVPVSNDSGVERSASDGGVWRHRLPYTSSRLN